MTIYSVKDALNNELHSGVQLSCWNYLVNKYGNIPVFELFKTGMRIDVKL